MNVDVGIWPKLTKIAVALLIAAVALGVAFWYLPLIRHNEALRKEILQLNTQVQQQEESGRQLENSIKAVRNDPRTVERIAREKLSYVKPGETMIRFEEPVTNGVPKPKPVR